jgi:curved DNA-binding protein
MGIDGAAVGRGDAPRQAPGGRSGRVASPATAEAIADITLEEAFHGTTRRVEIQGKRLEVTIPRGADNGTKIKLSGQGPGGGDLVVVVHLRPHPVFGRKGLDLERELPITLGEALLGAEVPVSTLKGKVLLKIPAGTQNGHRFRLKGQGMPHLRKEGFGDLYARARVVLPPKVEGDAAEAARAFIEQLDQPDPRTTNRSN